MFQTTNQYTFKSIFFGKFHHVSPFPRTAPSHVADETPQLTGQMRRTRSPESQSSTIGMTSACVHIYIYIYIYIYHRSVLRIQQLNFLWDGWPRFVAPNRRLVDWTGKLRSPLDRNWSEVIWIWWQFQRDPPRQTLQIGCSWLQDDLTVGQPLAGTTVVQATGHLVMWVCRNGKWIYHPSIFDGWFIPPIRMVMNGGW